MVGIEVQRPVCAFGEELERGDAPLTGKSLVKRLTAHLYSNDETETSEEARVAITLAAIASGWSAHRPVTHLTSLGLSDNRLGPNFLKALTAAWKTGSIRLTALDLNQNPRLKEASSEALVELCQAAKGLRELDVSLCDLGPVGLNAVTTAIASGVMKTSIERLQCEGNVSGFQVRVGELGLPGGIEVGVEGVIKLLEACDSLRELDVSRNALGNKVFSIMAAKSWVGYGLRKLGYRLNCLTEDGVGALLHMLGNHGESTLVAIDISNWTGHPDGIATRLGNASLNICNPIQVGGLKVSMTYKIPSYNPHPIPTPNPDCKDLVDMHSGLRIWLPDIWPGDPNPPRRRWLHDSCPADDTLPMREGRTFMAVSHHTPALSESVLSSIHPSLEPSKVDRHFSSVQISYGVLPEVDSDACDEYCGEGSGYCVKSIRKGIYDTTEEEVEARLSRALKTAEDRVSRGGT